MAAMYGSSIWAKIAFACVVIALILFIVGFATTSWMVYQTTTTSIRVGLWKYSSCVGTACNEDVVPETLKTDAFVATQAFETIGLIFFIIAPFILGVYVFAAAARARCFAIFCMVVCFSAAFCGLIGMIIWFTYVNSPYIVSWSMGLTVLATILACIAGLLLIPDVLDNDYDRYDDRPPTYATREAPPPHLRRIIVSPGNRRFLLR